jgi:hypothetical protein
MLRCGHNWQPTAVDRVIETFPTSTRVAKVKTDAGTAFLKGMGNPAGNQSLAMELVGAELATRLGLYVPDFAVLELAEIEVPMEGHGPMTFGPAFVSREVQCITSDGSPHLVSRLADPAEVALLVTLDTWIRNLDRCPPLDYYDPEPRRDNLCFTPDGGKLKLMVIDHSHCFVEGSIEDEIVDPYFVDDGRIYGRFPEFEAYLKEAPLRKAADKMASIDATAIAEIVNAVPMVWGPPQGTRDVWIDQIVARQARVATFVIDALVSQVQMDV